ncbi:MAG: 2-C-methyl-D-erythritol 2,4-cyclodiphosphate synthase [Calditrichaeota bacterium]|nr:MAG: 2-C-methyl-D-erythritol 2,4-cyclodiphosphate synthase [Calditrichota bacterium]
MGDALLGSAALGDLGAHFPDSDDRFAGISSLLLLKEIRELLERTGFRVNNVDATVVLERPRLAPYIEQMRRNIAESLGVSTGQVSVKATSSEKMGFVGEGKGVAVFACALVEQEVDGVGG